MIQIIIAAIAVVLVVVFLVASFDGSNPGLDIPVEKSINTERTDNNVATEIVRTTETNTADEQSTDTILNVSGQALTLVPKEVFSKTELETLDLSDNNLSGSLPGEIRFLQNLKVLNLSNNQFTGVPAEIGQLQNLEVLDLSNNKITGLPNELGNLPNLKVLDIRGNSYSEADLSGIKKQLPASVEIRVN